MPRQTSDREAIEAEIAHVRSLGLDELHTLWRLTFRSAPPPAFTKDLMARFLCWDIQEQAFGGLDPETAKHLDGLAQGNKPGRDRPSGRPMRGGNRNGDLAAIHAETLYRAQLYLQ